MSELSAGLKMQPGAALLGLLPVVASTLVYSDCRFSSTVMAVFLFVVIIYYYLTDRDRP